MSTPTPSPTPTRPARSAGTQLRRWGPLALIVGVLALVAVLVVVDDPDGTVTATGATAGTDGTGDESSTGTGATAQPGPPPATGVMPITYDEAVAEGTEDDHDWGERCDPSTGLVKIPTVYAAPCVPVFDGDNGGATSPGVTADTVKVVWYHAAAGADATALLSGAGLDDTPESELATLQGYVDVFASVAETYGRTIELVRFEGTGASDDEVAARADAVTIAEEIEPFAVIGGPALDGGAYAEELATRGVICIGCSTAIPDSVIQEQAPYLWGSSAPSTDQLLAVLDAWLAADDTTGVSTAEYAGDPAFRERERTVGIVHFEQDPPVFVETAEEAAEEGEDYALREPYVLDVATLPEKARDLVAKLQAAEITTVLFLGDPLMPIYLTRAATEQGYFPEWVFTGTALTDTNVFGRQYDPQQMAHAFGLSTLAAPLAQEQQGGWQLWQWYHGPATQPPALSSYNLLVAPVRLLVSGIHMAGPDLTPETFAQGLFRIPPAGGGPTAPQVSYGTWGLFPEPDYNGIDDAVEMWWDPTAEGEDEIGRVGAGMWRRSDGARRFTTVDAPMPAPFVPEGAVTDFDAPPPEDATPSYPPPPGSPAAAASG